MGEHGYAAFAPEDREDAKRRRPAATLEGYAAERGLDYRGRGRLAGFRRALPEFEEEQHNLMRGVMPGGRYGILLHEMLQTHGIDGAHLQGTFYGVRTSSPGWWKPRMPNRTDIPVLGNFLDPPTDDSPRQAFEDQDAWSPVTTAATPVPETVSRIDRLRLVVAGRAGFISTKSNVDLDEMGVPGWRANPGPAGVERLPELLAGPVAAALAELAPASYAGVTVDHGMVVVQRNGYLMEPDALDAFARVTCALGDGLAAACLEGRRPPPFDRPLAPCPWEHPDPKASYYGLPKAWEDDFRGFAKQRGLALEDPADWHEQFASLYLPGRALAVMRAGDGKRLLFATDVPVEGPRAVRGAVAFATQAADTPPGGIASPDTQTTTAVLDGVAIVWTHRWFGYTREAETLVDDALAAARAVGVEPA